MKIKTKLVSIVLFLTILILIASFGMRKSEWEGKTRRYNKSKTVRNPKKSVVHHLKILDKFGGMDIPEEQFLNIPVDITVSKEGQVYILDSRDNNIKIFQKDGSFMKCIGREGGGPGEFERPWILELIEDKIYVADTENGRIQVLTKDGKYQRSFKVPITFGYGMAFDSKGNLYLNTQGFRSPKVIAIYDNQGYLIREIGNLEGKSFDFYNITLIRNQIRKGQIPDSFKNDLLLIIDNKGNIFAVHQALNKFKKFSRNGEILSMVKIEAKEYKNIYKAFVQKNEADKRPGFYPLHYINDLALDDKENLYILLNEPSRMIIFVYSNEGEFKGKLLGAEDNISRIAISHDDILYALGKETHFIYKFSLDFE